MLVPARSPSSATHRALLFHVAAASAGSLILYGTCDCTSSTIIHVILTGTNNGPLCSSTSPSPGIILGSCCHRSAWGRVPEPAFDSGNVANQLSFRHILMDVQCAHGDDSGNGNRYHCFGKVSMPCLWLQCHGPWTFYDHWRHIAVW
ncbi:hypothetical protein PLEOSDRAFT_1092192 [Pleurotus ostreatus PC15]|uniref:Uncharacterized protein n=1 Tax=Pleurotus ostreatus (strain PC15) TaxID=1137138 RepID=A0A067P3W5_PLEO1|nr:hypothetical protein PLEOSDRAFT_1092192 [Pleurotus ostreatus PC15]